MKRFRDSNYLATENGEIFSEITNKFLKPAKDTKGYLRVVLSYKGVLKTFKVHRLICECFHENPENKKQVNHKDGNKENNNFNNLEWCTQKENTEHAIKNNLFSFQNSERSKNKVFKKGTLNGMHILKEFEVLEIRRDFKPRVNTRKMLAQKYNVTENCIKDVIARKSWKHI